MNDNIERLWAPWRMAYVGGREARECIFCAARAGTDDRAQLVLHRGEHAFAVLNLFPYNTGHLMIVPNDHAPSLADLSDVTLTEIMLQLRWLTAALERVLRPGGLNVGLNLGAVAGAGVAEHLHVHVVPRWLGDANFMPILAQTMVLPELLPITYAKLCGELARAPFPRTGDDPARAEQAGGVVIHDEHSIALRRTAKGEIVLPKGHIESGEAAFMTAIREVEEETGLATSVLDWVGDTSFDAGGESRHVGYFLLRTERASPTLDEHLTRDTELVPIDRAESCLTFVNDRAILTRALELYDRSRSE